jgi:hypothetical protein
MLRDMLGKRQYSIRFLLLEIFLVALALGLIREAFILGSGPGEPLIIAALFVIGAALGGLFGSMAIGIGLTVVGLCIASLLLAAVSG